MPKDTELTISVGLNYEATEIECHATTCRFNVLHTTAKHSCPACMLKRIIISSEHGCASYEPWLEVNLPGARNAGTACNG